MKNFRLINLLGVFLVLLTLFGPGVLHASAGGGGVVFTVTSVNDGDDATPGDGICATAGTPTCTFRAAIEEANADAAVNTIDFNIASGGTQYLSLTTTPLPNITAPVFIDGTSQPNCTVPCIVLSGASLGPTDNGLTLNTDGNLIQGLDIVSFGGAGIMVGLANGGGGNIIRQNDIGFIPGQVVTHGNGTGIYVSLSALYTTIGGTTAAAHNVISGNTGSGIYVDGGYTTIQGNYIGTNAAGTGALANGGNGITLSADASKTKVGGAVAGAGNKIAFNTGRGVSILNLSNVHPTQNAIRRNSIFSNGRLGIDLNNNGVTLNDTSDPDVGANGLQNYPVLSSATSSTHMIVGTLNSKPGKTYVLEFFSSPSCDPSGHGEGKTYIGTFSVTTNSLGNVSFSHTVTGAFAVNAKITATATDPAGNTSEFSVCRSAN
jgi:CSLREA domain-containing protein